MEGLKINNQSIYHYHATKFLLKFIQHKNVPELNQTFPTQSAFTCSKLTIVTLEQGLKYVQS